MFRKGTTVQLNNDRRIPLEEGTIVLQAGCVGTIETPGDRWARVRFTETISCLVPVKLLNERV